MLPGERRLAGAIERLSPRGKKAFFVFFFLMVLGAGGMLIQVNRMLLVEVPAPGGHYSEGIVGTPAGLNPVIASTDASRDLVTLLYSGLLRATPEGYIPDLARSYSVSEDNLSYTFILREGLQWHDGNPVTADDVIFTIEKIQNPEIESPKRSSWEGVGVEKIDAYTIRFTLSQPYAPFIENATVGIIPKHIWQRFTPEQFKDSNNRYNVEPIGTGPYRVISIKRGEYGLIEFYELAAWNKFALGEPYLNSLRLRFYDDEAEALEGLRAGEVGGLGGISSAAHAEELREEGYRVESTPLPLVVGLFFNQNQMPLFTDKTVREALALAIDKERIVRDVLLGYGTVADGPIPPGSIGYVPAEDIAAPFGERLKRARTMLEAAGWSFDEEKGVLVKKTKKETQELSFSISTVSPAVIPELKTAAQVIEENWRALGARIEVKIFEEGTLRQNVIRPRKYDVLFFGQIIGRDADPFAFWHSSQRLDPGLNVALYTNVKVDKLLEEARATSDAAVREEKYRSFSEIIQSEVPAIFVYSRDFIYIVPERIRGLRIGSVTTPAERFLGVHDWHINIDRVWPIFNTTRWQE